MPDAGPAELALKIVEKTPDAVIFADVGGIIRLWNGGATRIFGFAADEMVGHNMDAIIPERLRQRHWDAYHAAMAAGVSRYGARSCWRCRRCARTAPASPSSSRSRSCVTTMAP